MKPFSAFAILCVLGLGGMAMVYANQPPPRKPPVTYVMHYTVDPDNGMMIVHGTANGKALEFAIDTGASVALVQQMIPTSHIESTHTSGIGGEIPALETEASICIETLPCKTTTTEIVNPKNMGPGLSNLLPLSFLSQFSKVEFDFTDKTVTLTAW